jgi:hypothetical protein
VIPGDVANGAVAADGWFCSGSIGSSSPLRSRRLQGHRIEMKMQVKQ